MSLKVEPAAVMSHRCSQLDQKGRGYLLAEEECLTLLMVSSQLGSVKHLFELRRGKRRSQAAGLIQDLQA